ncbi:MAG TPA: class F sortase [Nocardioidaceae bacterium]|nr:class F sortase [Nocardioidaceae bacterium]
MTIRTRRLALSTLTALTLLAAGWLLFGLGSSADAPAGSRPGATAAGDPTGERGSPARRGASSTTPVEPQRLRIPSLGIDAPVLPITSDGASLVPPSDPQAVGWWSDGARPGSDRGTAILTGHTVSTGGGVFDDLDQMRPGQRVQILSNGPHLRLRVSSVTIYHKTALAEHAAEIFDQATQGRVALVTCDDWTGTDYLSNVVVIATPTS